MGQTSSDAHFITLNSEKRILPLDSCQLGERRLFCLNGQRFAPLSDDHYNSIVARGARDFTRDEYAARVLPSLLLGSVLRDADQTPSACGAVVRTRVPLVFAIAPRPVFLGQLTLTAETGERFSVRVDGVDRSGAKIHTIFATPLSELPASVIPKSRLTLSTVANQKVIPTTALIPPVTALLTQVHNGQRDRAIDARWPLLDRVYGAAASVAYSAPSREPVFVWRADGSAIQLNAEQSEAVRGYNNPDVPAFAIEAPPGSGKTLTAAAMAVAYTGGGLQLFLSTANVPVFNMALAMHDLSRGALRIVHVTSAAREAEMSAAQISAFSIMNTAAGCSGDRLRALHGSLQQSDAAALTKKQAHKMRLKMRTAHAKETASVGELDVVLSTVDTVLGKLIKAKNPKKKACNVQKQLERSVRRVVIDEASQMTEAALNAVMLAFPLAQIVLIGDSRQLPPFKYERGDLVSEMAAHSALEVLKRKQNLPVIMLRQVYRASADLIAHYSSAFYGGALVSGKPAAKKRYLSGLERCIEGATPVASNLVFLEIAEGATARCGTSLINDAEAHALERVITFLRHAGHDHRDVMVICYYEAQRQLVADRIPEGYEVLTVDSAQGREKDIVILLTTRTSPTDAAFFSCKLRCNVAMSRHKEALIVLGAGALLTGGDPWKSVLDKRHFAHHTFRELSV